ncbi:MAG: hypothetical protein Q7T63_14930 [Burkholderiaceae bacterium]|nr:hypothetical protein [Burkholderiaceae bacterium]MDP3136632.1 hypothetical protein [Burkholderiaceae bacterium]
MHPLVIVFGVATIGAVAKEWMGAKQRSTLLQKTFTELHEAIKHEQFGERELLRQRRELLLEQLGLNLPEGIRLRAFDQGSYAMQTGVRPLCGEFDIDIGLILQCDKSRFANSIEAKRMVHDALARGSRSVSIRRSCVTVHYTKAGFGDFHVDIAVYATGPNDKLYLARGRERSKAEKKIWEHAEPERLTALVNRRFSGAELTQFRRCIRYLKRWKQVNFTTPTPYSIALTIAAYHWFQPHLGFFGNVPNDLEALLTLTERMLSNFSRSKLQVPLPVAPCTDLMASMTEKQMVNLEEKLKSLYVGLEQARDAKNFSDSLKIFEYHFGVEFG